MPVLFPVQEETRIDINGRSADLALLGTSLVLPYTTVPLCYCGALKSP